MKAAITWGGGARPGPWKAYPEQIAADGFPAKGGKAGAVTMTMTAVTQAFDTTIKSGLSDFWLSAVSDTAPPWQPFVITPGHSRTIEVTIKPSANVGAVVRGYLYLDDYMWVAPVKSGSEVTAIPYAYEIGSA